ncbi:MAG: NFACT RNA binding domain-containing protein [Anaerolineae bacterium]
MEGRRPGDARRRADRPAGERDPADPDGTVVAAAHLVTAAQTSVRTIVPGRLHALPPTPLKRAPEAVAPDDVRTWLAAAPEEAAWRTLVARVRGIGPLAAREAVFRDDGDARAPGAAVDPRRLADALADLAALPATHAWTPTIALRTAADDRDAAGDAERVFAWAPTSHAPGGGRCLDRRCPSTLDALARADAAGRAAGGDGYDNACAAVRKALAAAAARRGGGGRPSSASCRRPRPVERLRLSGDLILSFQWQIEPGATALVAPLDPPVDDRARSDAHAGRERPGLLRPLPPRPPPPRRAAQGVPQRLTAAAPPPRPRFEQLAADLALAENRPEIDAVLDLLAASGLAASPIKRRGAPADAVSRPRRYTSSDGLTILVGRNSRQNEIVTFTLAARGDLWLHARDVPGAHVVVKAGGRPVPEKTVLEAAALAAWFSGARDDAAADVAVTDARHVRRLGGGGVGMVTLSHDATRTVRPASPRTIGL